MGGGRRAAGNDGGWAEGGPAATDRPSTPPHCLGRRQWVLPRQGATPADHGDQDTVQEADRGNGRILSVRENRAQFYEMPRKRITAFDNTCEQNSGRNKVLTSFIIFSPRSITDERECMQSSSLLMPIRGT